MELSQNPAIVFPQDQDIRDFQGNWWVAHTKARNEKALAKALTAKNISYFLPLVKKTSKTPKGRVTRSMLPLFPGYMFFCCDEQGRTEVLKTNRVANIIPCRNKELFVSEIWSIQKALETGSDLKLFDSIEVGQKCRVITGPLAGIKGTVIQNSRETRLILQVEMLGQSASVEIDIDLLEKI